jgi:hypothetical protein
LFLEEHDKNTIWEDIDFVTSLKPDYLQFAQLGPIPGTKLYSDYERQGKLLKDIPYSAQHGQGKIWFKHEHFTRDESEDFLRLAFEIDYSRNGASMLRAIKTTLGGYEYCLNHENELVRARLKTYKNNLKIMRYFLMSSTIFVQNRQSELLLKEIKGLFRQHFGKMSISIFAASMLVVLFGVKEYMRCRLFGDVRTPKTSYRLFNKVNKHVERLAILPEVAGPEPSIAYSLSDQIEH